MNITVHQNIVIHSLRVDSVANSSVLQIGSAGSISCLSNLYNTGSFTGPGPELNGEESITIPLVPLAPPTIL